MNKIHLKNIRNTVTYILIKIYKHLIYILDCSEVFTLYKVIINCTYYIFGSPFRFPLRVPRMYINGVLKT